MNDYFYVPILNSLHFYYPGASQFPFNTEFIGEAEFFKGFTQKGYCQKVNRLESKKVQFQSNYTTHTAELLDIDDNVVSTLSVSPVFTPVLGNYTQYEFTVPFNTLGYFRVRLTGSGGIVYSISEWIEVRESWDNTLLVKFSNSENDELLFFESGFTADLRVECHFYKRVPTASNAIFRSSDGKGISLASRTQRKQLFEAKDLPSYLHEQLLIGFSLDTIEIGGVFYFAEEAYSGPQYSNNLYMLSNGSVILEYIAGFDAPANFDPKSPAVPGETFNIITENSDPLVTENGDNIVWRE